MKPGGIHPGLGVAGANLTCGNIRCGVDREVHWDRQFGEVYGVALDYSLLPGCAIDALDGAIILAALAKRRGERARLDLQCGGDQPPVAGEIGDNRHVEALDPFEYDDGTATGTL